MVTHNEMTYNTIKDTNSIERVWELYGSYNHIANNEVRNCAWTIGNTSHPDIFQVFGTSGAHDQLIENNYFHDFAGQIGNLGIDGNDAGWYNWTFRNNIFANIYREFFIYFPVYFYNNTFYRVQKTRMGLNTRWLDVTDVGHVYAYNNAFIACGVTSNQLWVVSVWWW